LSDAENKSDRYVLDSEPAQIRRTGGVNVQRIPVRWKRRQDLKAFWDSDLEIRLVREHGETFIEIRRTPKHEL